MAAKRFSIFGLSSALVGGLIFLGGCETEGPAEKAGKQVDENVEKAQDALDPRGPAEKVGDKIDEGVRDVKDAVNPPGPAEKAGRAIDDAAKQP